MKITPVAGPNHQHAPIQQTTTNNSDARSRAIAALTGTSQAGNTQGNAQEHPVANANNISAEEVSAVRAQSQETTENINNVTPIEDTTTPAVEAKPPQVDPETDKKFQELTRQERIARAKVVKMQTEMKAAQDALNAREAALAAREAKLDPTQYIEKSRFKADPLSVMAENEVSYDTVTEQLLKHQPKDPRVEAQISRLEQTIKNLEAKLDNGEKAQAEQRTADYQNALKQIERDTTQLVKSDPETYEAIAKTGSEKAVTKLIERTYREAGVLLSIEEAAEQVEEELVEQGIKTYSNIDKIKKRLAATANASTATAKPQDKKIEAAKPQQTQPQMKTLTNAQASTRKLSARERALLAFKGEKIG